MSKFKNIILFASTNKNTALVKAKLENIKYIKLFETPDIDEVQQIIDMSDKAVVLVDDEVAANKVFRATLNKKKARFKKFYINWYSSLAKGMTEKLLEQDFTLINSEDIDTVMEKVELYLFGRIKIFSNTDAPPPEEPEDNNSFKKGYFTHLEKKDRHWKILISSHETDDEINNMLGKNWDLYLQKILEDANDLKDCFETRLETAPYQELVWPHFVEGKLTKLSIVHVNLDENFASNIMNVHNFLKTL